jgi:hypothetical protein
MIGEALQMTAFELLRGFGTVAFVAALAWLVWLAERRGSRGDR